LFQCILKAIAQSSAEPIKDDIAADPILNFIIFKVDKKIINTPDRKKTNQLDFNLLIFFLNDINVSKQLGMSI
jgi:hypothetical protein